MGNYLLMALALVALLFCSCKEKKETRTIITKVEKPKVSLQTQAMPDESASKRFEWGDAYYEAEISRTAEKDLPVATDADGNKYYDNAISLSVTGPSGKVLERVFHKTDFADYIDANYIKPSHSVLVNLMFTAVEGGSAVFVATVGSPDVMDDEYMSVRVKVTKAGAVMMENVEEME